MYEIHIFSIISFEYSNNKNTIIYIAITDGGKNLLGSCRIVKEGD